MVKVGSVVVALVLSASPALAQTIPTPDQAEEGFKKMDTNHDGVLTLAEWKAGGRLERGFQFIDADGDGKVTLEELKTAMAKFQRGG